VRALFPGSERKSKTSIAISVAVHVVVIAALAAITFRVPLEGLFQHQPPTPDQTIRYIRIAPEQPRVSGGTSAATASPARTTAATTTPFAPRSIPVGIPKPVPPAVIVGTAPGSPGHVDPVPSLGRGVQPGIPDTRIAMDPMAVGHLPKTDAQRADSALSAIYTEYLDSVRVAQAHPGRAPGDWTWAGKDGSKWGWDPQGIHIGGITIPNAVLAALPLNIGPTGNMNSLTDGRNQDYMRSAIQFNANAMSEDDFRAAVNRIRERVDRERQERLAARRRDTLPPS
jgi:hypothetical protein